MKTMHLFFFAFVCFSCGTNKCPTITGSNKMLKPNMDKQQYDTFILEIYDEIPGFETLMYLPGNDKFQTLFQHPDSFLTYSSAYISEQHNIDCKIIVLSSMQRAEAGVYLQFMKAVIEAYINGQMNDDLFVLAIYNTVPQKENNLKRLYKCKDFKNLLSRVVQSGKASERIRNLCNRILAGSIY